MKNPIRYLQDNWLKYGFETAAIIVGILGAFALSTWHETRKEKESENEYLVNLQVDLEGHLVNIESQIEYENNTRKHSEEILAIIELAPYDIQQFNSKALKLGRRSFVNSSPVFEDLKYSGHLSLIKESGLRQAIFKFYQYVDYVETVIASNNSSYADAISYQSLFHMSVLDFGYTKNMTVGLDLDFSLDVEPFSGADEIIASQLENNMVRLTLHNMMAMRGRSSTLHIYLLEGLKEDTQQLIMQLADILKE